MTQLHHGIFSLDCLPDSQFHGVSSGEEWNGFARPYFTFDQAQEIVGAWRARGWEARYESDRDAFAFSVNQNLETGKSDEFEEFTGEILVGEKLYPVGGGSWTWDSFEV